MRQDLTIDWAEHYARNLVSPEEAAAAIQSGDHIWIAPLHACPAIIAALAARAGELHDVELRGLGIPDVGGFMSPEVQQSIRYADQFGSVYSRAALEARVIDYHPHWLVGAHKGIDAGRLDGLSSGEKSPIDAGRGETAWAQNRRAEFVIVGGDVLLAMK